MAKKGRIPHKADGSCPEKAHPRVIITKKGVEQHICEKDKK